MNFIWQQGIYGILFSSSALLLKSWRERFSVLITIAIFSLERPIRLWLELSGNSHLAFIGLYQVATCLVVAPLLFRTKRLLYWIILHIISSFYFLWEYLHWYVYSPTWGYYWIIQMFFMDMTLAVLIFNRTKIITWVHIAVYSITALLLSETVYEYFVSFFV